MVAAETVDVAGQLAQYGIAAPLIGGLLWYARKVTKERDTLADRVLSQQESLLPLVTELKDVANRATAELAKRVGP